MRRLIVLSFASLFVVACGSSGSGKDSGPTDTPVTPDIPVTDLSYDLGGDDVPADDVPGTDTTPSDGVAATRHVEFLVDTTLPIQVPVKQPYTIRAKVVDDAAGQGVNNVAVSFDIVKVTEGLGGEELKEFDSTMETGASITDETGRVDGVFLAAESIGLVYTIELTAKDAAPGRIDLVVMNMDCAKLLVKANYAGSLSPAASFVATVLTGDNKCADLDAGDLPNPVAEATGADFAAGVEVVCVPPGTTFTVFVTAKEACPFAAGCVEGVASGAKDTTTEATADLEGVDVTLDGAFTVTHKLNLNDVLPADCTGVATAGECAAPDGLSFTKLACCYLDAIQGFFTTDAAGFATALKAATAGWSGGKVPAGKEADFAAALDQGTAEFLAGNTPAWVASYAVVGTGVLQAVRQVNLTSTLTLQPANGQGELAGKEKWTAYSPLYWKVGCDPLDPNYFQCGKCTYLMDKFGGVAYTPVVAESTLTVTRGAGNLFDESEHAIAMNPGRLLAFVANDMAANALTGGQIRDGIYKDGAAKNVADAARLWLACKTLAPIVVTKAGAAFTGTAADLETACGTAVDGLLASQGTLLTAVTKTSQVKVAGKGSWTDTNCDLKADRFQNGEYTGTFEPASGDPIPITGSFSANRN